MKNKKKTMIGILSILVCVMAIGYALLTQELTINGRASIDSTWKIEITNVDQTQINGSPIEKSKNYTATTANFDIGFTSPGDFIIYEIEITNYGTLDAVVESINVDKRDNPAVKYTTSGLIRGDKLEKNGSKHYLTLKLECDPNITTQPTTSLSEITITINYQQDQGQIPSSYDYAVGDTVNFAGSKWYVIKQSTIDDDYITVMKEKVLTNVELGEYAYNSSSTMSYYWDELCHSYNSYGYSNSGNGGCDNTNSYTTSKVKEMLEGTYINSLGSNNLKEIDGYKIRLITRDELFNKMGYDANNSSANLGFNFYKTENVPAWVYQNFKPEINYVYRYWTMTPGPDSNNVWYINSYGELSGMCIYCIDNGVRPVINLYKSAIGN